ncbi:MAG: hypothetical protein JWM95_681 [Gemmatimonadetes bacterium]|nr:hypothetical protein [Gemmatimonadota bacterium]
MARRKRGFALVAVLWVLTVATVLSAATVLVGRGAYGAARNRTNAERAYWRAEECVAMTIALVDRALAAANESQRLRVWRTLDVAVDSMSATRAADCAMTLRSFGSSLDVNAASDATLQKFFVNAAGETEGPALADAVLDWRDTDVEQRPAGAEASWYEQNARPSPRNDLFAADGELTLVKGLEHRQDLLRFLTTSPSRICLSTAPAAVLAALPGFTEEAVTRVLVDRAEGRPFIDLSTLMSRVSHTAADSIAMHFEELATTTSIEPQGWSVVATVSVGWPAISVSTDVWFDRYADHAVIVRHRSQW